MKQQLNTYQSLAAAVCHHCGANISEQLRVRVKDHVQSRKKFFDVWNPLVAALANNKEAPVEIKVTATEINFCKQYDEATQAHPSIRISCPSCSNELSFKIVDKTGFITNLVEKAPETRTKAIKKLHASATEEPAAVANATQDEKRIMSKEPDTSDHSWIELYPFGHNHRAI